MAEYYAVGIGPVDICLSYFTQHPHEPSGSLFVAEGAFREECYPAINTQGTDYNSEPLQHKPYRLAKLEAKLTQLSRSDDASVLDNSLWTDYNREIEILLKRNADGELQGVFKYACMQTGWLMHDFDLKLDGHGVSKATMSLLCQGGSCVIRAQVMFRIGCNTAIHIICPQAARHCSWYEDYFNNDGWELFPMQTKNIARKRAALARTLEQLSATCTGKPEMFDCDGHCYCNFFERGVIRPKIWSRDVTFLRDYQTGNLRFRGRFRDERELRADVRETVKRCLYWPHECLGGRPPRVWEHARYEDGIGMVQREPAATDISWGYKIPRWVIGF